MDIRVRSIFIIQGDKKLNSKISRSDSRDNDLKTSLYKHRSGNASCPSIGHFVLFKKRGISFEVNKI